MAREIARIVGATKRGRIFRGRRLCRDMGIRTPRSACQCPTVTACADVVRDNLPDYSRTLHAHVLRRAKAEKGYKPDSGVVAQINRQPARSMTVSRYHRGDRCRSRGRTYLPIPLPLHRRHPFRAPLDKLAYRTRPSAMDCATSKRGSKMTSSTRRQSADAMVCARYWENRRFTPAAFWQLHIATDGCDEGTVKFSSSEKWKEKESATELYNKVKSAGTATVTKAERKEKTEETPLLYDPDHAPEGSQRQAWLHGGTDA